MATFTIPAIDTTTLTAAHHTAAQALSALAHAADQGATITVSRVTRDGVCALQSRIGATHSPRQFIFLDVDGGHAMRTLQLGAVDSQSPVYLVVTAPAA